MEICSWIPLVLHKNKGVISRYPVSERTGSLVSGKVFSQNNDEYLKYGRDINPSQSIFTQYQSLFKAIPIPELINEEAENADYSDVSYMAKNIYLSFACVMGVENVFYSYHVKENCNNVFNSLSCFNNCENIYSSVWVMNSQNIYYSKFILDGYDLRFCSDCVGCSNCILCTWLVNQSYCIKDRK